MVIERQRYLKAGFVQDAEIEILPAHQLADFGDIHLFGPFVVIQIGEAVEAGLFNEIFCTEINFWLGAEFDAVAVLAENIYAGFFVVAENNAFQA